MKYTCRQFPINPLPPEDPPETHTALRLQHVGGDFPIPTPPPSKSGATSFPVTPLRSRPSPRTYSSAPCFAAHPATIHLLAPLHLGLLVTLSIAPLSASEPSFIPS